MDKEIAIVIEGRTTFQKNVIEHYKNIKNNIIISTLDNENIDIYKQNNFCICHNKIPEHSGYANLNYQVTNVYNGIIKAEKMGFKYVMKIRSDMFISDTVKFIDMLEKNKEIIYFPAYHNWDGGYFVDYIMFGHIDNMKSIWNLDFSTKNIFPERQINDNISKNLKGKTAKAFLPIIYKYFTCFWIKKNIFLNDYEKDKLFIYDDFII